MKVPEVFYEFTSWLSFEIAHAFPESLDDPIAFALSHFDSKQKQEIRGFFQEQLTVDVLRRSWLICGLTVGRGRTSKKIRSWAIP